MNSRRKFIKQSAIISAGTCCGLSGLFLQGCSNLKSVNGKYDKGQIVVPIADLAEEKKIIVNNMALQAPIYLSIENNKETAVLLLCTHNDCELKPTGTYLFCPCHGSEFTNEGQVTKGPANENLAEFIITKNETNYYLKLRQ
ncbi:MAG: Rieske (2Fe-2S) protein [Flavobacteriales bacterium]|nr:Rieske (2Fe-2S) protein [Flavobacteriales bacterium]